METYGNFLSRDEWALIISLAMLIIFMSAFFLTAARKRGKSTSIVPADQDVPETEPESLSVTEEGRLNTENTEYETITNWISLRHAGALSHSGKNGSRSLSESGIPKEFRDFMSEIGLDITVTDIRMKPERHVQLEIRVNEQGFFEAGKRKGPSPYEYTLPRITYSKVKLNIWQPFINHNQEQVYSQIRFGRLQDASQWRIVFEIQNITENFSHIDYELYWDRVQHEQPADVRLGGLNRDSLNPGTEVFFRK